jgi:hypothetical protein
MTGRVNLEINHTISWVEGEEAAMPASASARLATSGQLRLVAFGASGAGD